MIVELLVALQMAVDVKPIEPKTVDPGSVTILGDTEYGPPLKAGDLPARLKVVRGMLDDQLIDYGSARFKRVQVGSIGPRLLVCGEVNSRNRMGGYTGWTPFVAMVPREERPVLHILQAPLGASGNDDIGELVFTSRCLSSEVHWFAGEFDVKLTAGGG